MKRHDETSGRKDDPEASASPPEADELRAKLSSLELELEKVRKESQENRDKFLRARADYENLVKRSQKEALETVRSIKGALLLRLAGLVESLGRVHRDVSARLGGDAKGMELVLAEGGKLLAEEGLLEIPAEGHDFNYRVHQAVERVERPDVPEGTIVGVVQKGYKLGEEVLRPALVRVSSRPGGVPRVAGEGDAKAR